MPPANRHVSTRFYDQLEATFRADDTAVVRIVPPGHIYPASIRAALRARGLYVTVSARREDRPYMMITLDTATGPAIDPPASDTEAPEPIMVSEEDIEATMNQPAPRDPTIVAFERIMADYFRETTRAHEVARNALAAIVPTYIDEPPDETPHLRADDL